MSTNVSKEKRQLTIDKIYKIKDFLQNTPDENAQKLIAFLGDLENDLQTKKFGLLFEEHREEIDNLLDNSVPILKEDKKLEIANGGEQHFLIEGDNLPSLKLLEKTHREKIDLIYIDPPYNRGKKDFIYDDDYVDKVDTFKHSKIFLNMGISILAIILVIWLGPKLLRFFAPFVIGWLLAMIANPLVRFLEKRLKIAKKLLKDSAAIFISIDWNEQASLKMLCDSVFGENNFISCISCSSNPGGDKGDFIETTLQYLLVYAKNKSHLKDLGLWEEQNPKNYKFEDEFGKYKKGGQLEKWGNDDTTHTHPNLAYSIYFNPNTNDVKHLFDYNQEEINENRELNIQYEKPSEELTNAGYFCIRPRITNAGENGRWRMEPDTFYQRLKHNDFIFENIGDGYKIYEKDRFEKFKFKKSKDFIPPEIAQKNSIYLLNIFGKKVFYYPKPLPLI